MASKRSPRPEEGLAMVVYTNSGRPVALVDAGSSGSEGVVYDVVGDPQLVAKIYHADDPDISNHQIKVEAMARCYRALCDKSPDVMATLAWPSEALYADETACDFVGFMMRRFQGDPLPVACEYPRADAAAMRRSLGALKELCLVVDFLHHIGICVGDWNPYNFVASDEGHIGLLDVDGFHLVYDRRLVYPCGVCAEGYVAPELVRAQRACGLGYREMAMEGKQTFTPQTDNFGLAVAIFRALDNWVHPFSGSVVMGPEDSYERPRPVDELVADGASPFVGTAPDLDLKPWALPLELLPPLFQEAFRWSLFDGDPDRRLELGQWGRLLGDYLDNLVDCPHGHAYHQGFSTCPYCYVEAEMSKDVLAPKVA